MKPGPATSTPSTISAFRNALAVASAISFGFLPTPLAVTIAALVAQSPCVGSRGGSTTTRDRSVPGGNDAAVASITHSCTLSYRFAILLWGTIAAASKGIIVVSQNGFHLVFQTFVAPLSIEGFGRW